MKCAVNYAEAEHKNACVRVLFEFNRCANFISHYQNIVIAVRNFHIEDSDVVEFCFAEEHRFMEIAQCTTVYNIMTLVG